jgi:eukaryotic-like serine/threonine-protein kinase
MYFAPDFKSLWAAATGLVVRHAAVLPLSLPQGAGGFAMRLTKTTAHQSDPPDNTSSYVTDGPSRDSGERPAMALLANRPRGSTADLERLLQKRLLIVALVVLVPVGFSLVFWITGDWGPFAQGPVTWLTTRYGFPIGVLLVAVYIPVAVLLRCRPLALTQLRLIEAVMFSLVVGYCAADTFLSARWILLEGPAQVFVEAYALRWLTCILVYGILIPNTARRCLLWAGLIGIAGVVSLTASLVLYGTAPELITREAIAAAVWMGIAVTITASGAHWIEQYRRQAIEARRLGHYVLGKPLGSGGMGAVYLAEHVLLRRPCAIKLVRAERANDPYALRRFEREVRATATLTHPNTVQVYDYGCAEDGTFYYVMEYLPGVTLGTLVQNEGPLPPPRAIHFLRQVCGSLKEAHGRGLIHRDIKPGNVIICERGGIPDVAKLLDFGLVLPLLCEVDGEKLTQDGTVTGTPAYLSPEQADGQEQLDARSDIYSPGALAYFLLTGNPPFAGRSAVKMIAAHLYEEPERLSAHRPDLPGDLEVVALRCLAKKPEGRFPDVESLDRALAACITGVSAGGEGQSSRAH